MDNGYRTKPIWVADDDGHVDALFVLPFEQRPIDENVLSNGPGIEIREAIEGSMQTYGVVTLKRTSGPWITQAEQDADTEERVPWLTRVIAKRTPNVVVFLGVNAARQCIPEIKDKSVLQLKHTFQTWKIQGDGFRKSQLCFVYQQPTAIVRDHEDHFRIPEQFAKIRAASRGLGYHKLAESKSLGFKAACRYIDWLCNDYQGMIAFDTETYSLNQVHNTRLGTMQFATETDKAYVLLWDTDYCPYTPAEKEILRKKLVRLFGARKTSLRGWIMHNAQFDMGQVFAEFKVRIPYSKLIHDTMNLLHLLDENQLNRNRDVFKLKEAAKQFLGYFKYDSEAIEARSTGVIMDLPVDKLVAYGGMDAYVTLRLYRVLMVWAKLTNYHDNLIRISNELHNRALRLYAELKQNGFGIDQYRLRELLSPSSVIKKRLTEIEQIYRKDPMILAINEQIYKRNNKASKVFRVPFIFDMNKPGFRNELFFHSKLGYKLPPNGEGKFSSNKKFQELYQYALDADGQPLYPLVALFQEAQSLSQLTKMYIKPIYESIAAGKHGDTCDGRVHSNFNMAGTVTGRMSSNGPNLQQVPRSDTPTKKAIKALFIAQPEVKRSGKIVMRALMQADFKAAEVRMWGALSNDRKLCALLRESFEKCAEFRANPTDDSLRIAAELTGDVHKQTASLMFSVDIYTVPWDEPMYKDMRQGTKSITFGMMFDRGIKSLAAQIKKTEEEAQGLQDKFFGKFCEGKAWLDNQKATMRDQGYVETPFGRRRRSDIIYSDDRYMRQTAERHAVNSPIQSTASDYAMFATSLLQERILEQGLEHEYKIVNSVHDSVVVDFIADYEHMKWLSETIREIYTIEAPKRLEAAFDFKLLAPMDIDLEISYRKYRKCDECGAMFHMHEDKCTGKIKTGEKDDKGKPVTKKCGSKKFHEEAMRYHSYGYSMTLVETPEGLANAALSF